MVMPAITTSPILRVIVAATTVVVAVPAMAPFVADIASGNDTRRTGTSIGWANAAPLDNATPPSAARPTNMETSFMISPPNIRWR